MADKLYDVVGIEIFATGTHNGDTYTEQDLDHLIAYAAEVGFTPPLKDGHHLDKPGMPSLGWVKNLRRVGAKLLADFMEMPQVVYEAIKQHRYDRVSSEIFWDYSDGKKVYDRVLKAVALLGADIPAIAELKPLREVVFGKHATWQATKWYEIELQEQADQSSPYQCPPTAYVGKLLTDGALALHAVEFYDCSESVIESWLSEHNLTASEIATLGSESYRRYLAVIRSTEEFEEDSIKSGFAYKKKNGDMDTWVVVYDEHAASPLKQGRLAASRRAMITFGSSSTTNVAGDPVVVITSWDVNHLPAAVGIPQEGQRMDPKIQELTDKLTATTTELTARTKELSEMKAKMPEGTPQLKALAETVDTLTKQLAKVTEENTTRKKEVDELTEKNRQNRIKEKTHACRVPSFRGYVSALYDITTKQSDLIVKVYDEKGTPKDTLAETVIDELVTTINKATEHLFIQQSRVAELRRDDQPSGATAAETVDLRVKQYMHEHPELKDKYVAARDAIFEADPALKEAYAKG